jgi:hypothetical protein
MIRLPPLVAGDAPSGADIVQIGEPILARSRVLARLATRFEPHHLGTVPVEFGLSLVGSAATGSVWNA